MSQVRILETLFRLGFTQLQAEVYFYLAKNCPCKASNVARELKIRKQTLYPILKKLEKKGIVTVTLEKPADYSAIPFRKMLDQIINAKLDKAKDYNTTKNNFS